MKIYSRTVGNYKSQVLAKRRQNLVGWIACLFIITAYALLSFDVFTHKDIIYNCMNLVGGVGLAWRVYQDRNYSNFMLEILFILIALKSILL